jgi:hypothetical protein
MRVRTQLVTVICPPPHVVRLPALSPYGPNRITKNARRAHSKDISSSSLVLAKPKLVLVLVAGLALQFRVDPPRLRVGSQGSAEQQDVRLRAAGRQNFVRETKEAISRGKNQRKEQKILTDGWRSAASHGSAAHRCRAIPIPSAVGSLGASLRAPWGESRGFKRSKKQGKREVRRTQISPCRRSRGEQSSTPSPSPIEIDFPSIFNDSPPQLLP